MDPPSLVKVITPLLNDVDQEYSWSLPSTVPVAVVRSSTSAINNLCLRKALHEKWKTEPWKRAELAGWYVRVWGGVRRTSDAKIAEYVDLISNGHLPSMLIGVASWSKIASVSDPDRFLIYDARVAAALNFLQLKHFWAYSLSIPAAAEQKSNYCGKLRHFGC